MLQLAQRLRPTETPGPAVVVPHHEVEEARSRRAARQPGGSVAKVPRRIEGMQAALVFGLRNARAVNKSPGDAGLVDGLGRATGEECLDAAFNLARGVSAQALHALSCRPAGEAPPNTPFADGEYYGAIARWLGVPLVDAATVVFKLRKPDVSDVCLTEAGAVLQYYVEGVRHVVIAPAADWLPGLAQALCRQPELGMRVIVAPPDAIRIAAEVEGATVQRGRIMPLHTVPEVEVADRVVSPWQALSIGGLAGAAGFALLAVPTAIFLALVVAVTGVLVAYTASRALALMLPLPPEPPRRPLRDDELPVYTVLVPLYREDEGVGELVAAMARLDYPADRLDIQFLIEADDPITRTALIRETRRLPCRVCVLPEGRPRTKPRALNAGLRQARGTLLTIYDAEDRPDPGQLRRAAETFAAASPEMAAYQARLCIDHVGDNWLTKMFAVEYACQFDRLMPMVAGRGGLVLLGGTSNHFRTDALLSVGGWDPFNVTEDADLAIRLRRRGYRLGMIASDTSEEAPLTVDAWIKQRSRWFKGYLQTWLVHHRQPVRLVRTAGWRDVGLFNLYIVGAFTAAFAHNAFLFSVLLAALKVVPLFGGQSPWLASLLVAFAAVSYGVNFALGACCIRARGTAISPWAVAWFPFYWVLMGLAAMLAVHDLVRRPHHWRKTTHGVAKRPAGTAAAVGDAA